MSLIDEIKAAADIVAVAEQYTEVRRSGPRRSVCRCLCGENSDRTPSFMLYEDDDHFHCFACNRHGSVIDLVMLAEGCDLPTALDLLRRRYLTGEAVSDGFRRVRRPDPPPEAARAVAPETRAVLGAAVAHYQRSLRDPPGAAALAYLHGRGLSDDTIDRLRLGYAEGLGLARALHAQGFSLALAMRAGLLNPDGTEFLRRRVVFPVLDTDGSAVFLMGRATRAGQQPKYLGLRDELAHKQPMRAGVPTLGTIIVEGAVDFAALVQWGLPADYACVALLGTAHGMALDWLIARGLIASPTRIVLDQDMAGRQNALSLARALAARGYAPKVVMCRHRYAQAAAAARSDPDPQARARWQAEVDLSRRIAEAGFALGVDWGGAKDCGDLLQRGAAGREAFAQALALNPHSSTLNP